MSMRTLGCTPEKAETMLNRNGIRRDSDFGRKLQRIIREADSREEEVVVDIMEREAAQMKVPFVLSQLNGVPEETLLDLFRSEYIVQVIKNWPDSSLKDEDYSELVTAVQEYNSEMSAFMNLDRKEVNEVVEDAVTKV